MTRHSWLAVRAFVALALTIGFYVLAIGVAIGLFWFVYAQAVYAHRVIPKLAFVCIAGGVTILWSILPRIDTFVPPGPLVSQGEEPALFDVLRGIASATNQDMPREVYLMNDVNAFVAQRGGIMGIGSRRVMGLGLPLMQALTVQEFKAVLAHEFGHYHSGDVALGPLIHKTRAAIVRTVTTVSGSVLRELFLWYAKLFLRITEAVSRRQEYIADELASRVAGAGAMIAGLRKTHAAASAFGTYLGSEVAPVLGAGYVPPVSEGFARFLEAPPIASGVQAVLRKAEAEGSTDLYDSHPCLKDRVTALGHLPQTRGGDSRPATALLANLAQWERRLLAAVSNENWVRGLKAVEWDRVVESVYVPNWRAMVKQYGRHVKDLRAGALPLPRTELARIGGLLEREGEDLARDARIQRTIELLGASLSLALLDAGWTAESAPGEEIVLRREGQEIRPGGDIARMDAGVLKAEAWRQRCAELGIADLLLKSV
jgi:heat shock protein HtpX